MTPFYLPRSNPDAYSVTLACIEPSTIESVTVEQFDGLRWEEAILTSAITSKSAPAAK